MRRPPAPSALILVLLLAALAVGAAASIVAAARTASSSPLGGNSPIPEVYLSDDLIIVACILLFLAIVVPLVYDRIRGGGASVPGRVVAVTLMVVLAMIVFVVVARFATAPGGPFELGKGDTGSLQNNSTETTTNVTNTTNPLLGNGGNITFLGGHFPSWTIFVVIAVVAVLLALVAVPRVRIYLEERAEDRVAKTPTTEAVRGALGEAAEELAAGSDPRSVILHLYGQLLHRVGPLSGSVERATPEEIRSLHLVRLGIRPEAAHALTRLFEEARYSTHALGPEAASRVSQAIADAERDLARDAPTP